MSKLLRILIVVLFAVVSVNTAYLSNAVYDLQNKMVELDCRTEMVGANLYGLAKATLPPTGMLTMAARTTVNIEVTQSNLINMMTGEPYRANGTGFVVDNGVIITAKHVIARLRDPNAMAVVRFNDGRVAPVVAWAADPNSEVAVVKVAVGTPFVAELAVPGSVRPGDEVWAIGNPFNLSWSVTAGIVSRVYAFDEHYGSMQVDVPLNPGSSGSPVFDRLGRVVGMAYAIMNGNDVGFVIGTDRIGEVLAGLIEQVNQ